MWQASRRQPPLRRAAIRRCARIVRDAEGNLLHHDSFVSPYRPLRGLVEIGTG